MWGGTEVLIPQALYKNGGTAFGSAENTAPAGLGPPPIAQSTEFDIRALFNADMSWWFQGDGAMGSSQFDFETVATHEFLHGLGFLSGWNE
ncbi:hypothetical protein HDU93_002879, partial [Gonapodya sp. JEL0774]